MIDTRLKWDDIAILYEKHFHKKPKIPSTNTIDALEHSGYIYAGKDGFFYENFQENEIKQEEI